MCARQGGRGLAGDSLFLSVVSRDECEVISQHSADTYSMGSLEVQQDLMGIFRCKELVENPQ